MYITSVMGDLRQEKNWVFHLVTLMEHFHEGIALLRHCKKSIQKLQIFSFGLTYLRSLMKYSVKLHLCLDLGQNLP